MAIDAHVQAAVEALTDAEVGVVVQRMQVVGQHNGGGVGLVAEAALRVGDQREGEIDGARNGRTDAVQKDLVEFAAAEQGVALLELGLAVGWINETMMVG